MNILRLSSSDASCLEHLEEEKNELLPAPSLIFKSVRPGIDAWMFSVNNYKFPFIKRGVEKWSHLDLTRWRYVLRERKRKTATKNLQVSKETKPSRGPYTPVARAQRCCSI
jgi:hypothetical protein